jgi:hypothetical protein
VKEIQQTAARSQLDPVLSDALHEQVLHRDCWRCQFCGAMSNSEFHRKEFGNHSGDDSELNLITLCKKCHAELYHAS